LIFRHISPQSKRHRPRVDILIFPARRRASTPFTVSLPTCVDPFIRGFYDIALAAFANGPANIDLPSFE